MDVFLTIFAGVAVFVLGQIIIRVVIDPLQKLLDTLGKVSYSILFYSNVTPGIMSHEDVEEATKTLRGLASDIYSLVNTVPMYNLWFYTGILKVSKEDLIQVPRELVAYSNIVRISPKKYKGRASEQKTIQDTLINLLKIKSLV